MTSFFSRRRHCTWSCVLDQKYWPGDICDNLTFGEVEVRNICKKAPAGRKRHDSWLLWVLGWKEMPEKLNCCLCSTPWTLFLFLRACERGFLQMNLIITPTRALLLTKTVSAPLAHLSRVLTLWDMLIPGCWKVEDQPCTQIARYKVETFSSTITIWRKFGMKMWAHLGLGCLGSNGGLKDEIRNPSQRLWFVLDYGAL